MRKIWQEATRPVPRGMGRLREGLTAEDAADLAWLHIDPTLYARLVLDRGWSSHRFADWLARTMSWQLLGVRGAGPAEGRIGRSTIQLTSLKDIRSVSHSAIGGSSLPLTTNQQVARCVHSFGHSHGSGATPAVRLAAGLVI